MATGKKVEIEVRANVTGEELVGKLGAQLDSTGAAAKRLGGDAAGASGGLDKADGSSKALANTSNKLRDGMEGAAEQLARAKTELLALVGVGAGLQGVKDISALADSYKNLEARIKLTTGEGKAFDTAFAGVFEVAKRTNSAVEETGVLFTKLAEAGKTLGVSQSEALKLTETINQSIQLSGASAEASKASIIQLVQGLQSGVLRGDEFNSVMEQSPRLAKALADGLGTTTGELRKMAEAGLLTSATVIKALQNQSDVVQSEFGKLPATVGRAMTNLTTAFTAYVGEADKAHGYTAKLAGVIDALAGNLGTVATVLIHTGQVMGAMKLLSMAQDWLAASAAIKATAASTEVATLSTVKSTAAKVQNTAATVVNTAAQTANAAAWNDMAAKLGGVGPRLITTGTAVAETTVRTGLLGVAVGGLARAFAPLLALDIAFNFKQYGTAIGEWAARLMGAKDRTEELVKAEKLATAEAEANAAARKKQANAVQEAAEKQFELSKAAKASIAEFEKLATGGDSAAEAISKIGKDFDLASIPGIKTAVAVLDKLAADAKISAGEFQAAWAKALEGKDLAEFEVKARASLIGTAREAERTAQVLDATLREAVRRTGLDFDVISGGMSKASRSAINDIEYIIGGLDKLKGQGVDTAQVLTASFSKAINTADSQKAIDALTKRIESMRDTLGATVTNGLLDQAKQKAVELKDTLEKLTPGIQSVREALKVLGVTSDEELKKTSKTFEDAYFKIVAGGKASARELQEAFRKFADAQIAASDGVASDWLKNEATMRGLEITADRTGKAIVRAMGEGAEGAHKFGAAVDSATSALERQLNTQEKQIALQERQNALTEREDELKRKRDNVDKEGFVLDKNGARLTAGSPNGLGAYNKVKEAGGSEELALKFAQDVTDKKYVQPGYGFFMNNKFNKDISAAVLAEKKKAQYEATPEFKRNQAAVEARKSGANKVASTSDSGTATGTSTTVNVRITLPNGSVETVPTTEEGSKALIAALQGAKLAAGY